MPDDIEELTAVVPPDLSNAPPWAHILLIEMKRIQAGQKATSERLDEIAQATLGGGKDVAHAEQLRSHDTRITRLERILGWAVTIGTTILTAVGGAWAVANIHIGPPRAPGPGIGP